MYEVKKDLNKQDKGENEEPTEFGVVWERFIIPETEAGDIDRTGDESDAKTYREEVHGNGSHWTIEARKERVVSVGEDNGKISSKSASPSFLEFETFLEKQVQGRAQDVAEVAARKSRPRSMSNNDF